ncbi:Sodium/calcium exchanger protein-domain-containing protein [Cristinia sonorae]|uniref:Sodium/calcium exchanger protein-domain-containing protein n=1 Tax=Cristinia sonorae TaxID=1940300 RepID=A0A8K0UPS4_9AGAR|nr:Sodium/calcium exchanger protein-domain-containing protein [Cristinia sonorae]
MWSGLPKLFFVSTLVINGILWSQSRYAHIPDAHSSIPAYAGHSLLRRTFVDDSAGNRTVLLGSEKCSPLSFPIKDQCKVVNEECPSSDTFLSFPYVQRYFCAKPSIRPLIFTGYVFWLIFLFSTLGISASDFFCPNLGTLAKILGLDENVAGVTFLAFGNGSPDVFSTFSAMRTNSGGLAIGELLGAAAFVTSCVVGSMCIIKPFGVERGPFLRDVGFFTLAVVLLLLILWDHKITKWESVGMVMLYVFYVLVVVIGSWYEKRRERLKYTEALMRDEFHIESPGGGVYFDEPYRDEPSPPEAVSAAYLTPTYSRARAISNPGPPRLGLQVPNGSRPPSVHSNRSSRSHPHSRSGSGSSHITPHTPHMPSFSLIGALEFRRVVTSLQQEAAGSSLAMFDSPVTPYPGGHSRYHSLSSHHHRSRPHSPNSHHLEVDPWDAALGVPLDERSPQQRPEQELPAVDAIAVETPAIRITHTPASSGSEVEDSELGEERYTPPTRRQRVFHVLGHICHVLFPTLQDLREKSFVGKVVSVFAVPAVMLLTLTLPVVVTNFHGGEYSEKRHDGDARSGRLIEFEEEGVERTLVAEQEADEEMHGLQFNKWLMAAQCVFGPLWTVAVLFDGSPQELWLLLAAGVSGLAVAVLVAVFAKTGESPAARLARCTMGFVVAIVWIMAIADEVVEVLQTFGLIFGLSDAIIGLTVFAMGNSLADLVANMSVAVFAPIMGFSACFGGPMLNILLGVGISGTYIISQADGQPYNMHFSRTLVITGTGLLALLVITLVYVPWNGYFLNRGWGVALIVAYMGLMIANVVVEVISEGEG